MSSETEYLRMNQTGKIADYVLTCTKLQGLGVKGSDSRHSSSSECFVS